MLAQNFNIKGSKFLITSVAEPEPVGAEVFWLEPDQIFLGRLRLFFLASEKQNDLKMLIFHCILYIFLCCK